MLKNITSTHKDLYNTIFRENPNLLYSLSRMSLVEVNEKLDIAHFVLQIPLIYKQDIKYLFQSSQVGTHVKNNMCTYYNVPKHLYKIEGQFYPLNIDHCMKNNDLYVCPREKFSNKSACIQTKNFNCTYRITECNEYYEFDMSQIGILIRNNRDQDTFAIDLKGWYMEIPLNKTRTTYLDWGKFQSVQIGNTQINSPVMETTPLNFADFSVDTPLLNYYLNSDNITNVFSSICKKYNSTLEDLIPPLIEDWKYQSNSITFLPWFIAVSVIIVALIIWNIYLHISLVLCKKADAAATKIMTGKTRSLTW